MPCSSVQSALPVSARPRAAHRPLAAQIAPGVAEVDVELQVAVEVPAFQPRRQKIRLARQDGHILRASRTTAVGHRAENINCTQCLPNKPGSTIPISLPGGCSSVPPPDQCVGKAIAGLEVGILDQVSCGC